MPLDWYGERVKARLRDAQKAGIDTTMAACVLHAKANHGPGAHGAQRFETQTGNLERNTRIVEAAKETASGASGLWGVTDTVYARRIELGFQGKDARGRVIDQRAYPFLIPAANAEYPKLAKRIKRALG